MRRIAMLCLLVALAAPAAARAKAGGDDAQKADLPAGTARLAEGELPAGGVGERIRLEVALSRDPGDAALRVVLPRDVDVVGGRPELEESSGGRVGLDDAGRAVTLDLDRARAGDRAELAIEDRGLPAGTYDLPLRWVGADGTSRDAGELKLKVHAGEREPPEDGPGWNRVGEVRLESNASSDSSEESETFIAAGPYDSDRLMAAANKGLDLAGGFFLSNDAGRSWSERHLSSQLAVPGGTVQSSQLSGDPILAADDLGNLWAGGLTVCSSTSVVSRIFVERIPAGGDAFHSPGVGLPVLHGEGTCDADTIQDKPQMTIDSYPTSPTYGRLYVTWDDPDPDGGVNVVISSCDTRPGGFPDAANCDDPNQWSAPVPVSGPGDGSFISSDPAVGPDGRVVVTWWDYSAPSSSTQGNAIKLVSCPAASANCRSSAGFSPPAVLAQLDGPSPIPFKCPIPAQPGGRVGPVPSLAVAPDGRIYAAWSDLRAGSGTTRCTQGSVSTTEETWDSFVATADSVGDLLAGAGGPSASVGARVISDTGSGSDEWFPWVAVDRSDGQAYVDFYSTTGDAARATSQFFLRPAGPGPGTQADLGALSQVSSAASNFSGGTCCNFRNDYGDYTGLAAAEGNAFPIWTRRTSAADDGEEMVRVPDAPSPQLVLDGGTLSDAPGDGDGTLEPGEPFSLTVGVRDTGPAGATNLRGTLVAPAGGATIDNATAFFGDVGPGGTTSSASAYSGRIGAGVPCGVSVSLRLDIATDQGPESVPILLPLGCGGGGFTPPAPPATTDTAPPVAPVLPRVLAPVVSVLSPGTRATVERQRLSTVLERGLAARVSCARTCTLRLTLLLPPPKGKRATTVTLARLTVHSLKSARTVRIKLGRTARRRLRSSHRKKLQLQLVATTAAGGRQARTLAVTLR